METIEEVFRAKAVAFTKGDLGTAFRSIAMPTTIYVGSKTLFVESQEQLVELIKMSRDALLKLDYDRTEFDVLGKTPLKSDGVRVDAVWRHYNRGGEVIFSQDARYYCVSSDGLWRISLAELGADPLTKTTLPLC